MKLVHRIHACLFPLATVLAVNGCGTSYTVTPSTGKGDYSYTDLNSEFSGKEVVIALDDGREMQAKQIWFEADTVSWNEPIVGDRYRVPVTNVKKISVRNHLLGGLEGLGGGVIADVALLVAVSSSTQKDFPVVGFLALLGLPPATAVFGAVSGHRYEYTFAADSTNAGH